MLMDANEQIERFKEFMESAYHDELHNLAARGINVIKLNFNELAKFDHELADSLLENPEDTIRAAELSIESLDLNIKNFHARFFNLPKDQLILIRDLRSSHLDKFICIEGIVRQGSEVRPQVTSAKFECPSCGTTITLLQLDTKFREPTRCSCGRRGKFRLVSKDLVDAQRLVLEEVPESLDSGDQPKRLSIFLKEDLVEPKMERHTTPGSKVVVNGVVKEVPITLKSGAQSIRYDIMMETNYIDPIEKTYWDVEINDKDEQEIKNLSQNPKIYEDFTSSIASSVYGHDKVKEALALQLMGGVKKKKEDGTTIRGDIHILLVGDPGCIAGDSKIALYYKGMNKIENLGNKHLQKIKEYVSKIRKNQNDSPYDVATVFHHYKKQPTLKIITETGKEVICTYNQPFLTKEGWVRTDELIVNTKIRVMPKIPNNIKNLTETNFIKLKSKSAPLKEVVLPTKLNKSLGALYGYVLGDGHVPPNPYRITCYINDEETDLIPKLVDLWKETFNVTARYFTVVPKENQKSINEGGVLRRINSKKRMHLLEINSKQIAQNLSFLSDKRVPDKIFKSPNEVIAEFLSWLFEADGCAFAKGRGRTAIQLKSRSPDLLKDVQLLLLYFGIHSRIIDENLCIRRSYDMKLFAKHIGFKSFKKINRQNEVLALIRTRSWRAKPLQRYEKIKEIIPNGIIDVYDFEVPITHSFIANGIVCHNSAKSTMLSSVSKIAPKGRLVAGKSVSGVGLTASVVKDEFLRGWALEGGAMVLASGGQLFIDELDKMSSEDRDALHEALEQQRVSVAKANIQATLRAETTVLAAANPKLGRFDPYTPIAAQIDLPPTLINRFDLIFPIRDIPSTELDTKIATHVLSLQQKPEELKPEVPIETFKKYISYAKQKIFPKLTDEAIKEIKSFYVALRNSVQKGEGELRPIPISARQLEALVRLAEGSARTRLSSEVTREDAIRSINLLRHCLMEVGFDYETGQIDIDRITTGVTTSQRSKIIVIRDIIRKLESKVGKIISLQDVLQEASVKEIDQAQVEEVIEQLKREGYIFEPKKGQISLL